MNIKDDGSPIKWSVKGIAGEPGRYMVKTEQDVDDIVDHNVEMQNSGVIQEFSFGRKLASIPLNEWNKLIKKHPELRVGKHHPDYEKVLLSVLRNPDYRKFLVVDKGKV